MSEILTKKQAALIVEMADKKCPADTIYHTMATLQRKEIVTMEQMGLLLIEAAKKG